MYGDRGLTMIATNSNMRTSASQNLAIEPTESAQISLPVMMPRFKQTVYFARHVKITNHAGVDATGG
jgi:hypothetical protein